MGRENIEKNINCVINEGLEGITVREHYCPTKTLSSKCGIQTYYFSMVRNDMSSLASNRVMTIGVNKSANELFKEIGYA